MSLASAVLRDWDYRVEIYTGVNLAREGGASLISFASKDEPVFYDNANDLPQWVKERVAVLSVLNLNQSITNIGEQVLADVYYIRKGD